MKPSDAVAGRKPYKYCDAIFLKDDDPAGILEVEGLKPFYIIYMVGSYFRSGQFDNLAFAIIIFYSTGPKGSGSNRRMPKVLNQESISAAKKLSREFSENDLTIVEVDKQKPYSKGGLYRCSATCISARLLIVGKKQSDRAVFFDSTSDADMSSACR